MDVEEGTAWVQFEHGGDRVRWDLYANPSGEYGQVAFLAAFEPGQQKAFTKLTGIALQPIE